ncbi:MAG: hypothetical protein WD077_00855, partial [Bacteroidia bacterium]
SLTWSKNNILLPKRLYLFFNIPGLHALRFAKRAQTEDFLGMYFNLFSSFDAAAPRWAHACLCRKKPTIKIGVHSLFKFHYLGS